MPTIAEAQRDLELTNKDLSHLDAIITNIEAFMDSDQDRRFLKTDLLRYRGLRSEGLKTKAQIETWIAAQSKTE